MTKALILVGPKGAGKSFVGRLLERELSIPFLRVEPIWLEITRRDPAIGPQDFIRVGAPAIWEEAKRLAGGARALSLESTGSYDEFDVFVDGFRPFSEPKLIWVFASPETCLARVRSRDQADHIPVSDELVRLVNQRSLERKPFCDAELKNDPFATTDEVIAFLQPVLSAA